MARSRRQRPRLLPPPTGAPIPFLLLLLLLLLVFSLAAACHAFLGPSPSLAPAAPRSRRPPARPRPPPLPATAAVATTDAASGGDNDDDDDTSLDDEEPRGVGAAAGGFGLTWYAADRYSQQPDFPVLFVATRNESYAREAELHFSGQGYFVRSTRTVTRLAKMVRSTRPEGILLSDHLSAPHVLSFLESLRDLPDLWLVPVLLVHDPLSGTGATTTTTMTSTVNNDKEGGDPAPTTAFASYPLAQLHREAFRLGARCVVDPGTPGEVVQAMVEGSRRTRVDVEGLVHNLQGAVLHWAQHRRRLLPSTMVLEEPPPPFTSTEQEVLNLLCRGMTDAQISHSLGLTTAAVGHAARAVMEKLGCDLRGEVIRVALDNDLVTE